MNIKCKKCGKVNVTHRNVKDGTVMRCQFCDQLGKVTVYTKSYPELGTFKGEGFLY